MMKSIKSYFRSSYKDAVDYAQELYEKCEEAKRSYGSKDRLYKKTDKKEKNYTIAFFLFALLIWLIKTLYSKQMILFFSTPQLGGKLINAGPYLTKVMDYLVLFLLAVGVLRLLRMIYSGKIDAYLEKFTEAETRIIEKLGSLKGVEERIRASLKEGKPFSIDQGEPFEENVNRLLDQTDEMLKKSNREARILGVAFYAVLSFFTLIFFKDYIIAGLTVSSDLISTFSVCAFYFLLLVFIERLEKWLSCSVGGRSKFYSIGLFFLIQAVFAFIMIKAGMFHPINVIVDTFKANDENPALFNMTRAPFEIIITTVIGIFCIVKDNAGHDIAGRRRSACLLIIFALIGSWINAGLITDLDAEFTTLKGLIYAALGAAWIGIFIYLARRPAKERYGKRLFWVGLALFVAYLYMSIAFANIDAWMAAGYVLAQPVFAVIVAGVIAVVVFLIWLAMTIIAYI